MKQALIVVDEINRMLKAIQKTNSQYLVNDYSKNIYTLKQELKEYCGYRGYDYKELSKQMNDYQS